jgi:hypothetical protein
VKRRKEKVKGGKRSYKGEREVKRRKKKARRGEGKRGGRGIEEEE